MHAQAKQPTLNWSSHPQTDVICMFIYTRHWNLTSMFNSNWKQNSCQGTAEQHVWISMDGHLVQEDIAGMAVAFNNTTQASCRLVWCSFRYGETDKLNSQIACNMSRFIMTTSLTTNHWLKFMSHLLLPFPSWAQATWKVTHFWTSCLGQTSRQLAARWYSGTTISPQYW